MASQISDPDDNDPVRVTDTTDDLNEHLGNVHVEAEDTHGNVGSGWSTSGDEDEATFNALSDLHEKQEES